MAIGETEVDNLRRNIRQNVGQPVVIGNSSKRLGESKITRYRIHSRFINAMSVERGIANIAVNDVGSRGNSNPNKQQKQRDLQATHEHPPSFREAHTLGIR